MRDEERRGEKRKKKVISIPAFVRVIDIESRSSLSNLEQQFILEKIDIHFQIKLYQKEGPSTYSRGTDSLIMRIWSCGHHASHIEI